MVYILAIISLVAVYFIYYALRHGQRICKFSFAVDWTEFKINAQVFNDHKVDKFYIIYFYTKIFNSCLQDMNELNKELVYNFFKKPMNYKLFRHKLFGLYCQNLTQEQRNLIAETTFAGYSPPIFLNDKNIINVDTNTFCVGSFKVHQKSAKLNWNKISTISSVMPLLICYFFYQYFRELYGNKKDFDLQIKNLFPTHKVS